MDFTIMRLNGPSVEDVHVKLNQLSTQEFKSVVTEFKEKPDQRFGDNLLMALSYLFHIGAVT